METIPDEKHAEHLQELAAKSWNLEMIISGAAIFLVSYLPDLTDRGLWYYLDNLATDGDLRNNTLPILAYSFFKVVAYVLIGTFVIHFILRAFWVGLVGLHAVYPKGIQYDKIPFQSDFSREVAQKNFGPFSDFVMRLDRLSNQVFSLAFLIALGGLGISLLYMVIFALTHPSVLPDWAGSQQLRTIGLTSLVVVLALIPITIQFLAKRPNGLTNPTARRIATSLLKYLPAIMLPLVYRPLTYINLIYTTNISRLRMVVVMVLIMFVVLGGVLWVFLQTQMDLRGRNITVRHEYFAQNNTPYILYPGQYDNLRAKSDFLPGVSIQSDVVEGRVLKVFVSYRKWLDGRLVEHCSIPQWPDSLGKTRIRTLQDSSKLECLSQFFRLSVNDSVYAQPNWLFYTHQDRGSYGLLGYIETGSFSRGKNTLTIRIPTADKADSLSIYGQVPFWYFPGPQ